MNKNESKSTAEARIELRSTPQRKQALEAYCKAQKITLTSFLLDSAEARMNNTPLQNESQNSFFDHSFYNFVQAYAAESKAVRDMLKAFNEREVINHE